MIMKPTLYVKISLDIEVIKKTPGEFYENTIIFKSWLVHQVMFRLTDVYILILSLNELQ